MKSRSFLYFLLLLPALLSAGPFPEFFSAKGLKLIQAEKRSQKLDHLPEGNGILLEIDESVFPYAELHLRSPRQLPDFREAEFVLKVRIDNPDAIRSFSLRLTDKNRETFQFPMRNGSFVKGENRIVFRVGDSEAKTSWGNKANVNRKIDYPVVLSGITCRIRPGFGRQQVEISSLELRTENAKQTLSERPFLFFDQRSKLLLTGANSSIKQLPEGILLRITGKKHAILKDHKWSLRPHSDPRQIVFHAEVRKGGGILQLDGAAGKGKQIHLETLFAQGDKTISLASGENSKVKFQKLTIVSRAPETEILFRSSVIRSAATAAEAIRFDVNTGSELHILKKGEEEKLAFLFTNTSPTAIRGTAEVKLRDFFDREIRQKLSFSLRPSECRRFPMRLPREHALGFWKAEALIATESPKTEAYSETSFAYLHPAGPTGLDKERHFLFSVCTHTTRWSPHDRKLEAEAAGLCGAKVVWTTSHWNSIQPEKGVWNYRDFDELVNLYGAQGIQLQSGLGYGTRWAAPEHTRNSRKWTDWHRAMPDLEAWRTYVSTTVARYKGRIRYWEVWNEPDLYSFAHFGADDYAKLLKAAWEEVKKVNPEAILMNGGFASLRPIVKSGKDNVQFQKDILRNCKGFYDVHAYHEHSNFPVYASVIDTLLLPIRKETGADAVPWYPNETAIASTGGGEKMQALTLFKKLLFSWSRGAIGYTWYNLRNDGFDPYNSEHHYGMMTTDFYPKPIYPVYNALAGLYGKAHFLEQRQIGRDLYLFLFRKGNDLLAAAWNEQNNPSDLPFVFRTNAEAAEQIDIMGNSTGIKLSSGTGIFTVGAIPVTLLLKNASNVVFPGAVVEAVAPQAAVRGKEFPLELKLRNPMATTWNLRFELEPSPLYQTEEREFQCRLKPDSKQSIFKRLLLSSDLPNDFNRKFHIRLRFEIPELKSSGTLDLPFRRAIHIPQKTGRSNPDFILDKRSQIFTFWEGQPSKKHLLWQGKKDLSAEIRLALNRESLNLDIDVCDDVHVQPETGRFTWKGDNVQLALTIPGQSGSWEIGLTRLPSGKSETFVWYTPAGFHAEKCASGIRLKTERKKDHTLYRAELPLALLGTSYEAMKRGIQFNLLINDNDGECRKGGIQIAPQLKNPERHPVLVFE